MRTVSMCNGRPRCPARFVTVREHLKKIESINQSNKLLVIQSVNEIQPVGPKKIACFFRATYIPFLNSTAYYFSSVRILRLHLAVVFPIWPHPPRASRNSTSISQSTTITMVTVSLFSWITNSLPHATTTISRKFISTVQ